MLGIERWVPSPSPIPACVRASLQTPDMARRASSKLHSGWILVIIAAIAVAVGLGVFLQNEEAEPFRTVPALDLNDYLNNANSLQGNVYKVKGVINQSLGYSRTSGRLFSVEVSNGSDDEILPILVPPGLSYLNLQKGQHYTFRLEVGSMGILRAQDMKKS
jgi:hypothetical protein